MKNAYPEIKDTEDAGSSPLYEAANIRDIFRSAHSDDFFQLLAGKSSDLIFHVTLKPELHFDHISVSCARITGYTPEEFYADPYLLKKCILPEDFHLIADPSDWNKISDNKPIEIRWIRKDGTIIWVEQITSLTRDKDGEIEGFYVIVHDITERIKAQVALKESESKYRSIFESANDVIVLMNTEGTIIDINNKVKEIAGYEREEFVGKNFSQLTPIMTENGITAIKNNSGKRLAGDTVAPYEIEMRKKNGGLLTFEANAVPLKIGNKIAGEVGILRDITNQKRSILALKESEEKFSKAFIASPNPVCIIALNEGIFLEVNESFLRFTGYSREEIIGHTPAELHLLFNEDDARKIGITLLKTGRVVSEEMKSRMKSGEIRTALFSAEMMEIGDRRCCTLVITDITERKNAQEALRESEEKFSKAFQASPSSLSISRMNDDKFIEVNDAFVKNIGYSRKEVIGHSFPELNIFESLADYTKIKADLLAHGRYVHQERKYRTKSGQIRTGLVSAEILNIGNEPCMIVINADLTKQKEAEQQLKLLSSVTQQITDSTIITDPNLTITYINKAAENMFGYSLDEVKGKHLTIFDIGGVSPSAETKREVDEALTSGKGIGLTMPKHRKDGTMIICDCRLSPLFDEKGEICAIIDVQRDVTKQKEVESNFQEHKKMTDSILDTTPEGVLVIDSHDRILLANKALSKIFHLNRRLINHKTLNDIFPAAQFYDLHKAVKKGGNEKKGLEFRYQAQSAEKIIYSVIVKMDGERTLLNFTDISRKREEEEKLYQTDRLASIGEMAAGLAHELNNPLTGILALSQLLTSSNLPEEQREDIECIQSEAKRAANIVKNVLLFARNKTGENGQSSPNEVIKEVLRLREYEERSSNINVVTNLEENLPDIPLEKGHLQQVLLNLISNAEAAIKEVNRPGTITITTQWTNNHVQITFSDNGCGIKKQIIRRIFDPFFTTKEIGKGTGLGLSICYSIIVKHGGKISVKSQVNEGATFTIKMPIVM